MDTSKLTTDELIKLRDQRLEELATIKTQVSTAKRRAYTDGVYADPQWLTNAEHAMRMKGVEHQQINRELGARRRDAHSSRQLSEDRMFRVCAKMLLTESEYLAIAMECEAMLRKTT